MIGMCIAGTLTLVWVASYAAEPKTYEVVVKDYPGIRGGPTERMLDPSLFDRFTRARVE